ncbi:unnamed protein product [Rhizoctonia solani]|uniref:Uncharacterized protein n=1 Tax=Rhizoctonia solani TaxID=456999 RepID=A0A8H3B9G2_9AGAM|nr:unnamed protein product [Rhizoctonia solani]
MWNFSDLQAYLLAQAETALDDVGKIEFAKEFNMKKWLLPAYLNLCRRSTPPTTDEATKLGVHSLLMVFRLREHYLWFHLGDVQSDLQIQPPGLTSTDDTLENRLKRWVDGGCQPE